MAITGDFGKGATPASSSASFFYRPLLCRRWMPDWPRAKNARLATGGITRSMFLFNVNVGPPR